MDLLRAYAAIWDEVEARSAGQGPAVRQAVVAEVRAREFMGSRLNRTFECSLGEFLETSGAAFVDHLSGAPLCEGGAQRDLTVDLLGEYIELTATLWFDTGPFPRPLPRVLSDPAALLPVLPFIFAGNASPPGFSIEIGCSGVRCDAAGCVQACGGRWRHSGQASTTCFLSAGSRCAVCKDDAHDHANDDDKDGDDGDADDDDDDDDDALVGVLGSGALSALHLPPLIALRRARADLQTGGDGASAVRREADRVGQRVA
eukprot:3331498-Rhodomonas_salina.1